MAPPFDIVSIRNTGPAENSGLDTLYVVFLRERDAEPVRFLFSVPERHGVPDDDKLGALIRRQAMGFANDRSTLEQFRERQRPLPEDSSRLAITLQGRD